jgi:hypothetical protein
MKIRLEGVSLKGKHFVRSYGDLWEILAIKICSTKCISYELESTGKNKVRQIVAIRGDEHYKVYTEDRHGGR